MYKNALKEDLIRVVEELDGTVESTDTVAKLKTKIEKCSTFESDAGFVKTLIKNYIDERVSRNERQETLEKQKIELAKLQLAQLEKEVVKLKPKDQYDVRKIGLHEGSNTTSTAADHMKMWGETV
ncbi:hypothetical protein TNCT_43201 [Trichonephila clavata]|uniref:Uncharacterized protein n=1 Tax=Trichonephila clavata TaxID=2740835 RepID=A0A8X6GNU3_TRICU|nr:hypothetical protein TNCT_43201 [Trichonephila clavata]